VSLTANKERGEVVITLDGKEYKLCPYWEIVYEIDDTLPNGLYSMMYEMTMKNKMKLHDIATVIFICLKGDKEAPTLKQICEIILDEGVVKFMNPMTVFMQNALGGSENQAGGDKPHKVGEEPSSTEGEGQGAG